MYTIDKTLLSTKIDEFLISVNEFDYESKLSLNLKDLSSFSNQEQRRANLEKRTKFTKFIFNAIDPNEIKLRKKSRGTKN